MKSKGGDGREFDPVPPKCLWCNDQGQVYEASGPDGNKMVPCPKCVNIIDDPEKPKKELSMGQYLVGRDFNPSGNPEVNGVKDETAAIMDRLHEFMLAQMGGEGNDAAGRCAAIALSKYEEGCMWAVKALTKPPL